MVAPSKVDCKNAKQSSDNKKEQKSAADKAKAVPDKSEVEKNTKVDATQCDKSAAEKAGENESCAKSKSAKATTKS